MEIGTEIGAFVLGNIKSTLDIVVKDLASEIKQIVNNKILEYQVEEYNRNYCTKTLLHRVQPKIVKEFYQPLFIASFNKHGHSRNIAASKRIATNNIKDLFKKNQYITLIGNAGSGKSTMVKYLFLNSIDTKFKIPIKVELRYLNEFNGNITDFIKDKIFKLQKLAVEDKIIERLLASGQFIIFLDGYDEINSLKKETITKDIDDLVKIYNKNNFILTTRPYTDIDLLPLFHNFEVCDLSNEEINQFIAKQIPSDEKELRDKIVEAVNNKANHSYKSFLSNPLLLSMFILTFQSYSNIPQKRSEFYSQVFDALFSVHDSMSKLAFVREKQCGLSKEQFIEVLKLFSFLSYFDETFIFSSLYLDEKLTLIKAKKKNIQFDNDKLIKDLQVAIGIINKEGTDYAFPHRSLQEYFAAIYIASLNTENKNIIYSKIQANFLGNDRMNVLSKENFYLLLSEVDEKGVIELVLIPLFDEYIKRYSIEKKEWEEIIDDFLSLHSVFTSFRYILKTSELVDFMPRLDKKFSLYMEKASKQKVEKIKKYNITDTKTIEKIDMQAMAKARKTLALKDIKPFMYSNLERIKHQKNELSNYLIYENKSDTDIILLI